jgi:hypothetical protein
MPSLVLRYEYCPICNRLWQVVVVNNRIVCASLQLHDKSTGVDLTSTMSAVEDVRSSWEAETDDSIRIAVACLLIFRYPQDATWDIYVSIGEMYHIWAIISTNSGPASISEWHSRTATIICRWMVGIEQWCATGTLTALNWYPHYIAAWIKQKYEILRWSTYWHISDVLIIIAT